MRCHMPHHVHIGDITGSAGLRQLLMCEKHAMACDAIKSVNGPLLVQQRRQTQEQHCNIARIATAAVGTVLTVQKQL